MRSGCRRLSVRLVHPGSGSVAHSVPHRYPLSRAIGLGDTDSYTHGVSEPEPESLPHDRRGGAGPRPKLRDEPEPRRHGEQPPLGRPH